MFLERDKSVDSDTGSLSSKSDHDVSDVDTSDFSDFDISLLDEAENVIKSISHAKEKVPKKLRKCQTNNTKTDAVCNCVNYKSSRRTILLGLLTWCWLRRSATILIAVWCRVANRLGLI